MPFEDTLGGRLPGGYDAIAIDELHAAHKDGTAHSDAVVAVLQRLRENYPNKGVYVAAVWAYGGKSADYSDQLRAVKGYADMLMLEVYIREGNPSYGWLAGHAADAPGWHAKVVIRAADGTDIASKEIDKAVSQPDWYWKWNQWSRIAFHFVPTSDTIKIVISDEPTAAGAVLYWDFIELEEAYPVPQEQPTPEETVTD